MPRKCAVHQPNLFPRLSTLAKLYAADVWVVLDDVQFNARDYQHRAWLDAPFTEHGQWLSLPVQRPLGRATRINEAVLLDQDKAAKRVAQLTRHYYGHTRRWAALRPVVDELAMAVRLSRHLVDASELATRLLLADMGWRGHVVRSSAFAVRQERSARLADLAAAVGADEYLCGTGGAKYLDERPFTEQGLSVRYVSLPDFPPLRRHKRTSGLWWLSAVEWERLACLLGTRINR